MLPNGHPNGPPGTSWLARIAWAYCSTPSIESIWVSVGCAAKTSSV